jgi:hypothetical protein
MHRSPVLRAAMLGVFVTLAVLAVLLWPPSTAAQDGQLQELREDIGAPRASKSREHRHHDHDDDYYDGYDDDNDDWALPGLELLGVVATAPVWAPRAILGDDNAIDGFFPRFPYEDDAPGYMMIDDWTSKPRRWAGRVRSDYATDFDDLGRVGGNLLLSTTSRFGLDVEMNHFEERRLGRRYDDLWLGDANVVYRFAQSEWMLWRAGIGMNWLADPEDSDFGVNFTYGVDVFPLRPWVISSTLDWGTLGSAELFHFRATAGIVIGGIETCTGYEYYDVDRFHFSGLVAGVRIWF